MDQYCVKSIFIWKFSGLYSPKFGLNKVVSSVNIRFQSECEKIRTIKTQNTNTLRSKVHINDLTSRFNLVIMKVFRKLFYDREKYWELCVLSFLVSSLNNSVIFILEITCLEKKGGVKKMDKRMINQLLSVLNSLLNFETADFQF